jgi:hypothetical protein
MADALESRLADLSSALEWPPTPNLVHAVGEAVRRAPQPSRSRLWWLGLARWPLVAWPTLRPARRGLALALVAALLVVGVVSAVGYALGGLRITFGEPPASVDPRVISQRRLGDEMSLDEALARAGFTPLLPSLGELDEPEHVFYLEPPSGGQLAFAYGEAGGLAAPSDDGLGLLLTQFRADIGPEVFEKLVISGTRVEMVAVGDAAGYWIEGGEHFIYYVDAQGNLVDSTMRLVGDTLIWEQDGLTLRIEGAASLDAAVRVAESMGE